MSHRIFYLRDSSGHPVGCVAYRTFDGCTEWNLSVLNPADRFNRSLARHIALGRLTEKPFTLNMGSKSDSSSLRQVVASIMQSIALDEKSPTRARKAAKAWLSV